MALSRLQFAIEKVSGLSRTIDDCVGSGTDVDMLRFVAARREVPEALRALASECENSISHLPAVYQSAARVELAEKRKAFQQALVEIQAKWPVSSAKVDLVRYSADKLRFNEMLNHFLNFIRTQFDLTSNEGR
jgi:hypothetical protein